MTGHKDKGLLERSSMFEPCGLQQNATPKKREALDRCGGDGSGGRFGCGESVEDGVTVVAHGSAVFTLCASCALVWGASGRVMQLPEGCAW